MFVEIVCKLPCHGEEVAFPGNTMMDASGGQEMAHVVEFMVVTVLLAFLPGIELNLRANVTVWILRLRDNVDEFIQFDTICV